MCLCMQLTDKETGTEKTARRAANSLLTKKIREMHSLRCDLNLKLGVGRSCPNSLASVSRLQIYSISLGDRPTLFLVEYSNRCAIFHTWELTCLQ